MSEHHIIEFGDPRCGATNLVDLSFDPSYDISQACILSFDCVETLRLELELSLKIAEARTSEREVIQTRERVWSEPTRPASDHALHTASALDGRRRRKMMYSCSCEELHRPESNPVTHATASGMYGVVSVG